MIAPLRIGRNLSTNARLAAQGRAAFIDTSNADIFSISRTLSEKRTLKQDRVLSDGWQDHASHLEGIDKLPDITGDPKAEIVEAIGRQLSRSQRRPEQGRLIEPGAAACEAVGTCQRRIGLTI